MQMWICLLTDVQIKPNIRKYVITSLTKQVLQTVTLKLILALAATQLHIMHIYHSKEQQTQENQARNK